MIPEGGSGDHASASQHAIILPSVSGGHGLPRHLSSSGSPGYESPLSGEDGSSGDDGGFGRFGGRGDVGGVG
jgi:hypothetical protein